MARRATLPPDFEHTIVLNAGPIGLRIKDEATRYPIDMLAEKPAYALLIKVRKPCIGSQLCRQFRNQRIAPALCLRFYLLQGHRAVAKSLSPELQEINQDLLLHVFGENDFSRCGRIGQADPNQSFANEIPFLERSDFVERARASIGKVRPQNRQPGGHQKRAVASGLYPRIEIELPLRSQLSITIT